MGCDQQYEVKKTYYFFPRRTQFSPMSRSSSEVEFYCLNRSCSKSVDNLKKEFITAGSLEMIGPLTVVHEHVCLHQDFEIEKWV